MRLGVPFIAPRQLEAIRDQHGRLFLPSVESGAPPDSYSSCPVHDFLLYRAPLVLRTGWRIGHCPVFPTDRWHGPRVARRLRSRPLATSVVGSPDSPVNFSRGALFISRE
jgi:hypothetical protein